MAGEWQVSGRCPPSARLQTGTCFTVTRAAGLLAAWGRTLAGGLCLFQRMATLCPSLPGLLTRDHRGACPGLQVCCGIKCYCEMQLTLFCKLPKAPGISQGTAGSGVTSQAPKNSPARCDRHENAAKPPERLDLGESLRDTLQQSPPVPGSVPQAEHQAKAQAAWRPESPR